MKYYSYRYRDAFDPFETALLIGDFIPVDEIERADILFLDHEKRIRKIDRPLFLYPHAPYAFYFWDSLVDPSPYTRVNFVMSEAAHLSMAEYGYPHRVETIGFSRCKVLPFQARTGSRLVYASAHLFPRGRWPHDGDRLLHERTLRWLSKYRECFEEVVVYYYGSIEDNGLADYGSLFTFRNLESFKSLNTATAIEQLSRADLVISCNTFGYISIAQGIPTVLIGHDNEFPLHSSNHGLHYGKYEKFCRFPLRLQDMTGEDLLALRLRPEPAVEDWKKLNIGSDFDPDRFLQVVKDSL